MSFLRVINKAVTRTFIVTHAYTLSLSCQRSGDMERAVTFRVRTDRPLPSSQQSVAVVGSVATLGNWSITDKPFLLSQNASAKDDKENATLWEGTVRIPIDTSKSSTVVFYRFVVVHAVLRRVVSWETIPAARSFTLNHNSSDDDSVTLDAVTFGQLPIGHPKRTGQGRSRFIDQTWLNPSHKNIAELRLTFGAYLKRPAIRWNATEQQQSDRSAVRLRCALKCSAIKDLVCRSLSHKMRRVY